MLDLESAHSITYVRIFIEYSYYWYWMRWVTFITRFCYRKITFVAADQMKTAQQSTALLPVGTTVQLSLLTDTGGAASVGGLEDGVELKAC